MIDCREGFLKIEIIDKCLFTVEQKIRLAIKIKRYKVLNSERKPMSTAVFKTRGVFEWN